MGSERKILMIGVLIIVVFIIAGLFASDWFFNRTLLTETLIGILIGTPLGWIGAYVASIPLTPKIRMSSHRSRLNFIVIPDFSEIPTNHQIL